MNHLTLSNWAGSILPPALTALAFAITAEATVTNVAWYRLGENDPGAASAQVANSTTIDFVGVNHLQRLGTPSYTDSVSTNAANRVGSSLAVLFNGIDQSYSNAVVSTVQNNFGLEAWVRLDTLAAGTYFIAYNGDSGANGWGIFVQATGFNATFSAVYGGKVTFSGGIATVNTTGRWVHVAVVRASGTSRFYVDGVAGASTSTGPNTPSGGFAIARRPESPGGFFPGAIDEVRVFTFATGQFSTDDLLVNQRRVQTLTAGNLTPTSATLNGSAGSAGLATTGWFEWGTTTNLGNVTPPQALGSDFTTNNFSEALMGLTELQTYHFRAVASNSLGIAFGDIQSFTTPRTVLTWVGTVGVEWSVAANWSPAQTPQAGNDLLFPNTATHLVSSNDIPGISIHSIQINAPMYLRGAAVTVSDGLSSATPSGVVTVECPIFLGGSQEFSDDQFHIVFDGGINLNGHNLTFNAIGNMGAQIIVSSVISGTGNILKIGPGAMLWQGAGNTFIGTLRVANGDTFFGKSAGQNAVITRLEIVGPSRVQLDVSDQIFNLCDVQIETGGQFLLNGHAEFLTDPVVMWDDAVIDGGGNYSPSAGLKLLNRVRARTTNGIAVIRNGILEMNSTGVTFDVDGIKNSQQTGFLDVRANIIGVGFSKTGNGELRLSGTNSFNGTVVIQAGLVTAAHATAFGDADGGVELRGGTLELTNVNVAAETLTVFSGNFQEQEDSGQVTSGAAVMITRTNSWGGPIILQTNLFLYAGIGDMTLSGPISGPGGLWMNYGAFHITGTSTNTFSGGAYTRSPLLTLNKCCGDGIEPIAIPGAFSVGAFSAFPQIEVRWLNSRQAAPSNTLSLHTNAFVNLNRNQQDFGTLLFNGGRIDTGPSPGLLQVTQQIISNPTNRTGRIDGFMHLLGPLDITTADGPVNPDLIINAIISEASFGVGSINKRGDGELLLSAANSSAGVNQVFSGILQVQHDLALGFSETLTEVFDGATLQVENLSSSFAEPILLRGAGRGGTNGALYTLGGCTIGAILFLQEPSTIRADSTSLSLFINQSIAGNGPLTKTGPGFLTFGGSSGNTYSGETFVNEGRLTLQKPANTIAIPSHLTIGTGSANSLSASVINAESFLISGSVTVNRNGLWNLNNFSEGFNFTALQGRPPLTLNSGGDVQTGAGFLILPNGVAVDVAVNPGLVTDASSVISGNLRLDAGPHHFTVGNALKSPTCGTTHLQDCLPELRLSAIISQTSATADIIKEGPGEMRLDRANSFTGTVTVNDGTLTVSNNTSLGTSAGGTIVNGNGSLAFDGGNGLFINNESSTMNSSNASALHVLSGTNTWTGPITLSRDTGIDVSPPNPNGNFQTFNNSVSGAGGLTKRGPGQLLFSGFVANTYAGLTTVAEGALLAQKSGLSLPGDVVVANGAQLATLSSGQFSSSSRVTIQSFSFWFLNSSDNETIRTLAGGGSVSLPSFNGGTLTINNDIACEFSGSLSGGGQLVKDGNGSLLLSGNSSSFNGTTTVVRGECRVDGNMANSPFTLRSNTRLRGDGSVGNITIAESGPTLLADSKFPDHQGGDLEVGNLTLNNFCNVLLDFFGPSSIGGNDSIAARGTVTLNLGVLIPSFRYAPREGDVIRVIDKLSAGAISGTFQFLPQNSLTTNGGIISRISYTGGTGNDVTLTVTNLPLAFNGAFVSSGNGNASIESDECVLLQVALRNKRATTLTLSNVQLRASFPQLLVTRSESIYAPMPAFAIASGTPFQIRTTTNFPCGASVPMEVQVTVPGEGTFAIPFTIPGSTNCGTTSGGACESCTVVSGEFTTNTPAMAVRPYFVGGPSSCFPTKACPGSDPDTNLPPARFIAHAFTNNATHEICVTAEVRHDCPTTQAALGVSAYLGSFIPELPCAGYLGDNGDSGIQSPPAYSPFSFRVPAGSNFVVVVTARTNLDCDRYTLELFGLPCPPPTIAIAPLGGGSQGGGAASASLFPASRRGGGAPQVQINWGTAYPDWTLQQASEVTGTFDDLPQSPVVINSHYSMTNIPPTTNQFFRLKK